MPIRQRLSFDVVGPSPSSSPAPVDSVPWQDADGRNMSTSCRPFLGPCTSPRRVVEIVDT